MTAPASAVPAYFRRAAILRPAGVLHGTAIDKLIDRLMALAQRANLVVVSLVEATVPAPAALARALRRPGTALSGPDQYLLLVGADDELLRELAQQGGELTTIQPRRRSSVPHSGAAPQP